MSNLARELVELTEVKPYARKALLLHVADTVRGGEWRFWRSVGEVARRLGTDRKVVRSHLGSLVADGLLTLEGDRQTPNGRVDVYALNLDALLRLPGIEKCDRRRELAAEVVDGTRGREPRREGSRAPEGGVESPPNHINQSYPQDFAKKKERHSTAVNSASDHLADDYEFAAWLAQEAERAGR